MGEKTIRLEEEEKGKSVVLQRKNRCDPLHRVRTRKWAGAHRSPSKQIYDKEEKTDCRDSRRKQNTGESQGTTTEVV